MAKITKIEGQKNKDKSQHFCGRSFFLWAWKETAIIFGLKVGSEVDEDKLSKAIAESETKRAFNKAADYLASRMHTKKRTYRQTC